LVFATCSSEPEEGEDLVAAFLGAHSAFVAEDPRSRPGPLATFVGLFTTEGFLRTWPHAHGLESFFAAVLRRRR
jgi:16S rRNA (cytosine967-C5)-methyltransferase